MPDRIQEVVTALSDKELSLGQEVHAMKRDFDLIRLLLLDQEGETSVDLSPYNKDQINYHKALLINGGLAEGPIHYPGGHLTDVPDAVHLLRLTWEGHEFLDKARNDTVWKKAKSFVLERGISLTIDAIKIALTEVVRMQLK